MSKDKILADWSGHAESEWMRKYGYPFTNQAKLIFFEGFRSAMERTLQILTANEQEDGVVQCSTCSGKWSDATDNEIAIKEIDRYIDNRDCPMPTEAIVHFELCKDWLQQEQECQ